MSYSEGILPVNKEKGRTAFYLVKVLRKLSGIKKIGHAGILDPFATGVMVMLLGRPYTKISDKFLHHDKEYLATVKLGASTTTYDCDGKITKTSDHIPTETAIEDVVKEFQGSISQIPPMYSAKKVNGQKLYVLARQGIEIERNPIQIQLEIEVLDYSYPELKLRIKCSKGAYMRTLAYDIGQKLGTEAHLVELTRTRSGPFELKDCIDAKSLSDRSFNFTPYLRKEA
ncbi:MAG: tRNA pseudouridine(55) synthase TruB [Simkania sp.]|nr:tRNA pseudouridine(55) synthase TruB [Simkania sp.]MCB1074501.1 tRNA pseudouridine(55) synthase TruB [Simkania sp.]MCB1083831.1 tRNA pseudouridine(55) synthase TruB [Simkania sp.]MCP5490732.1 tRNA pseudouridine(55) synthase TruB [Chlamydiales bacterium]